MKAVWLRRVGVALLSYLAGRILLDTRLVRVYRENLPAPAGLRAVQLSDLHGSTRFLNGRVVDRVNRLAPDMVFVTGDLANDHADIPRVLAELGRIRCPHIFFVPGNYEREDAAQQKRRLSTAEYQALLARIGQRMTVLVNAGQTVNVRGKSIYIHGFDNSIYGDEAPPGQDFPQADRIVLLAHSPSIMSRISEWGLRFDALLTGHTHGGQIRFWGRTIGSYRHFLPGHNPSDSGLFYVNRGLGTAHLPLRLGSPSEILLLNL